MELVNDRRGVHVSGLGLWLAASAEHSNAQRVRGEAVVHVEVDPRTKVFHQNYFIENECYILTRKNIIQLLINYTQIDLYLQGLGLNHYGTYYEKIKVSRAKDISIKKGF